MQMTKPINLILSNEEVVRKSESKSLSPYNNITLINFSTLNRRRAQVLSLVNPALFCLFVQNTVKAFQDSVPVRSGNIQPSAYTKDTWNKFPRLFCAFKYSKHTSPYLTDAVFICKWETKDAERVCAKSTSAIRTLKQIQRLHLHLSYQLHSWESGFNLEAWIWIPEDI